MSQGRGTAWDPPSSDDTGTCPGGHHRFVGNWDRWVLWLLWGTASVPQEPGRWTFPARCCLPRSEERPDVFRQTVCPTVLHFLRRISRGLCLSSRLGLRATFLQVPRKWVGLNPSRRLVSKPVRKAAVYRVKSRGCREIKGVRGSPDVDGCWRGRENDGDGWGFHRPPDAVERPA